MNNEIMSRVLQALDVAQSLLEKSSHHPTIIAAYDELRTELDTTINSTQCVWPMCKSEEFQNKLASQVKDELIGNVNENVVAGALFDFLGMLTSQDEVSIFSSVHNAAPAVLQLEKFAKERDLKLDEAMVVNWRQTIHNFNHKI